MDAVVLLILIALVIVAVVKRKSLKEKLQGMMGGGEPTVTPPAKARDPFANFDLEKQFWALKAPDLVKFDEKDFFVRRSVESTEGSYKWVEHLLDDGAGSRVWLSIEDDDGLDLGVWTAMDMVDIEHDGKPGDTSVVTGGKAFKKKESGTAQWRSVNSDDTGAGTMDYLQYEAADGSMLAFQRYDGAEWSASLGTRQRPGDFDVYPSAPTPQGE